MSSSNPLERFAVTTEMVKHMIAREFIWRKNLSKGYLHVWCGPPSSGKSTIGRLAAQELAHRGFDVTYINEDAGSSELSSYAEHASENGYMLLTSSLANVSTDKILVELRNWQNTRPDLSNHVFIFDTLKKFINVMDKSQVKAFMSQMRSLTVLGATILCLHHTTKRFDKEGRQMYDGVGDIEADVDETHYFSASKVGADELQTITITPSKTRSPAAPISFRHNKSTRTVEALDAHVDLISEQQVRKFREQDAGLINYIKNELLNGPRPLTDLAKRVEQTSGVNEKRVRVVIKRWLPTGLTPSCPLWVEERLQHHNTRLISLPRQDPFQCVQSVQSV